MIVLLNSYVVIHADHKVVVRMLRTKNVDHFAVIMILLVFTERVTLLNCRWPCKREICERSVDSLAGM